MSVYFVTGSLGSGKGLAALYQLNNYAHNGAKIAGNLDIHLNHLIKNPLSKVSYIRVPDRPSALDLEALGSGNDGFDPDNNSLLVLDECATWLNARNWNDKGRAALIDWLIHSRKHGWDVLLLVQSFETLDKQIIDLLMEYHVSMNNLSKFNIPLIGKLLKGYSRKNRPLKLPKYHFGRVLYKNIVKADSWYFSGKEFYKAYDTKQIFTENNDFGSYSLLPNWHLTGRYLPFKQKFSLHNLFFGSLIYFAAFITQTSYKTIPRINTPTPKPQIKQKPRLFTETPLIIDLKPLAVRSHVIDGFRFYELSKN